LLSALVLVLSPVYVWVESTRVGWGPRLLLVPLQVLLVVPGYFTGFLLAGWVMDATRPLAHRFRGYALRGSLGATAVYGAVGLVLPLLDRDVRLWPDVAATLPFIAAFGLLAGAGWWARDRLTGRLGPPPPRR
ncbi:MAG TPA: hypothetical protein VFQ45_17540, partial [Longimicrobium sp.]|nr:hypothetical protein [Longimicrobium sp.]